MSQGELANYTFLAAYLKGQRWVSPVRSFNRPGNTTAYVGPTTSAAGGMIANSTTAGSCTPNQYTPPVLDSADTVAKGAISFVALHDVSGTGSKTIRVHFMKKSSAPAATAGDGTACAATLASGEYLGSADVNLQPSIAGGSWGQNDIVRIPYELAAGESIWTYHEALTAYTPPNAGALREQIATERQQ